MCSASHPCGGFRGWRRGWRLCATHLRALHFLAMPWRGISIVADDNLPSLSMYWTSKVGQNYAGGSRGCRAGPAQASALLRISCRPNYVGVRLRKLNCGRPWTNLLPFTGGVQPVSSGVLHHLAYRHLAWIIYRKRMQNIFLFRLSPDGEHTLLETSSIYPGCTDAPGLSWRRRARVSFVAMTGRPLSRNGYSSP